MASTYKYELNPGQFLYLSNQGDNTTVTLSSGSAGQQQQSSNCFSTGTWAGAPQLYRIGQGVVVTIQTAGQTYYVQCQQGQIQMSNSPSAAITTEIARTQPTAMEPTTSQMPGLSSMPAMTPMTPMPSMPPMKMNNNPMSMQLGNMSMSMGSKGEASTAQQTPAQSASATTRETAQTKKQFCTQCGAPTEPTDKFCGACGNALS